jgi:hypothetical protein
MVVEAPAPLPLKRIRLTNIDPMEVEAAKVIFLPKLHLFMIFVYAKFCWSLSTFWFKSFFLIMGRSGFCLRWSNCALIVEYWKIYSWVWCRYCCSFNLAWFCLCLLDFGKVWSDKQILPHGRVLISTLILEHNWVAEEHRNLRWKALGR